MANITLGGVVLPSDLKWVNEHDWNPLSKNIERAVSGALVVQQAVKLYGRPITLSSFGKIWVAKSAVDSLYSMSAAAGAVYTLTLADNRNFSVIFAEQGLKAEIVRFVDIPGASDPYLIDVSLITVPPPV